eukprot:988084-Pelagomonas_calceolata.AAC.1
MATHGIHRSSAMIAIASSQSRDAKQQSNQEHLSLSQKVLKKRKVYASQKAAFIKERFPD